MILDLTTPSGPENTAGSSLIGGVNSTTSGSSTTCSTLRNLPTSSSFFVAYPSWVRTRCCSTPGLAGTLSYMYAYSLYLFFDFAGYTAFAIGVGLWHGFALQYVRTACITRRC